jgi:carbamate kinase
VLAAVNFVEAGGARAVIADLDDSSAALEGAAGTEVVAS